MRDRHTVIGLVAASLLAAASVTACGSSGVSAAPSAAVVASSVTANGVPTRTPGVTTGTIVFGTSVDSGTMSVASPITTAAASSPLGWVAHLSEPASATTLSLTVVSITANGNEEPVSTHSVNIPDAQAKAIVHAPDTTFASLGGGEFRFRYVRPSDGTVLAQGTITFTN